MRSCVLSIRYGDTMRLVIVVVHGPPVVIFGRRQMRGRHCSVDIEERVSKQVRDDAQVEIAFVVEVEDALECNDGEDSAVVVEPRSPSIWEYAAEFSAVISEIEPSE